VRRVFTPAQRRSTRSVTANVISLYRVPLTDASTDSLSADELERASRYLVESARLAFVCVRSTLRTVLGDRLGIGPAEVRLDATAHGRPVVRGDSVSFSVSHSGAIGLIAVADGTRRLGVDVEEIRPETDSQALVTQFLHPQEVAQVGNSHEDFFRCWTRKEAVVKALGQGVSYALNSFAVDVDAEGPVAVAGLSDIWVAGLEVDTGYAAALAADGDPRYTLVT
jgi:4'-phosphopantetheinyl transferase